MSEPLIELESAELGYGRRAILSGVSIAIRAGEFVAVLGPNGGGKSTLLRGLLGGAPLRRGVRRTRAGLRIAYVPQDLSLDREQPLTAADVVEMGAWGSGGARWSPRAALQSVGLAESAHKRFATLSGGQKQRTLLARALVCGPELLLLDEPASAADEAAAAALYASIGALATSGTAVVLVTHHPGALAGLASRVLEVANGAVREAPCEVTRA